MHDELIEAFDEYNWTTDQEAHQSLLAGRTNQHTGVVHDAPFAAFDSNWSEHYDLTNDGEIAPTLKLGGSGGNGPSVATGGTRTIVRRLTPLECERLMGWPDNYTAHGITDDGETVEIANTNRYRICGNGIVANVTEWIGGRLAAIETIHTQQEAA